MNYLSHAYQFLDDPYFVAGTSLPDWMSVVDRRNRARSQTAALMITDPDPRVAALAAGVMQHHHDDRWFHQSVEFAMLSTQFAVELRGQLHEPTGHQAGFVGHIVVELLLDAALTEQNPQFLGGYYAALESLDLELVQAAANRICTKPFDGLQRLIPRFIHERFLADYRQDELLWTRLNHVMRRVGLVPLPDTIIAWLADARSRVRHNALALLTAPTLPPAFQT